MHPELYNLLLDLDNSDDMLHYFKWTENEKKELVNFIGKTFQPIIRRGGNNKIILMSSIWRLIKEAEKQEEYEVADLFSRCLRLLEDGLI